MVYISQFKFILKNLTLTTTDLITNIRQDINKELEKDRNKTATKKTVFHKNIYKVVLRAQQICDSPNLHGKRDFHAKFINLSYWYRG